MATKIDISGDGAVVKEILVEGEGTETPLKGFTVCLHYTGTLLDGTKFDSSRDRNQPFEFQLGTGAVIRGFEMGIPTMKKGEKCVLTCAPEFAYGAQGSPPNIPPNATLNFELEMLGWKGEDLSPDSTGEIERFILTAGEGQSTPSPGDNVDLHVVGKYEGTVFDERDLKFDLIEAAEFDLCKGVEIVVEKMRRNETAKFVIKSRYAFGKDGNTKFNIPGGATIEYTITLRGFTSIGKVWKMDENDKLNRAQITKDRGVEYIKKERYQTALNLFKFCENFLDKDGTSDEVKKLKLAVALNTALCHQKLNNHAEGKNACNEALALDPENVKALYRRGQFLFQLWDLDEAEQDFNKVLSMDPKNTAAQNQITLIRRKRKETKEQEKKLYASIFSKMAKASEKEADLILKKDSEADPSVGEWSDEEEAEHRNKEMEKITMLENLNFSDKL